MIVNNKQRTRNNNNNNALSEQNETYSGALYYCTRIVLLRGKCLKQINYDLLVR
jgi:hypothetical protein